jgi:hypothetical protein
MIGFAFRTYLGMGNLLTIKVINFKDKMFIGVERDETEKEEIRFQSLCLFVNRRHKIWKTSEDQTRY